MNKNLEKRLFGALVASAFAFTAFVPAQSAAAPLVVAGDIVKLYDGPGTTGGGEFWADVVGKGVNGTMSGTNNDFISFCLEYNETFPSYGYPLMVQAVSTAAVNGGLSGGNPDYISNETAWLYTNFANGTLAGYSHITSKANSLQRAIWYLEEEYTTTQAAAYAALDTDAKNWVDDAYDAGWTNIGNVRVLNLLKKDSAGNYTLAAQDQLYITPIPEPETYAMLLAGLGLMGFVARRRRQRGAA